jgi:hypothetical protein
MVIATRLEDRLISPTSEIIPAIYVIRNSFLHDFPTLATSCFLVHHPKDRESGDYLPPGKVPTPRQGAAVPWNPLILDLATGLDQGEKMLDTI